MLSLFEFVAAESTPKNVMLRAVKNTVKKQNRAKAAGEYQRLVEMFGFAPKLEELLGEVYNTNKRRNLEI